MIALCVDDEPLLLSALCRAVEASPDISETVRFTLCSKALEWAEEHKPDIAFLDVQMRGMGGLELSKKLLELYPDLPVVFCTGYKEYALDAMKMHASGYVVKPVTHEAVQKEIDYIKNKFEISDKLKVQCFGTFEVFANGKPLTFKRKRSKELLAYLVDRRGASVSSKEICAVLWEDDFDTDKNMMHLYKLFGDLRAALDDVGFGDVLIKNSQQYSVDTEKIDCDYYRYLAGDTSLLRSFNGEYMAQYSWAEEVAAVLQDEKYDI